MSTAIEVAIIEDDDEFRKLLEKLLDASKGRFRVIASLNSAEKALVSLPQLNPAVALVDINLADISGVECVRRLSPRLPDTQFMMVTVSDDNEMIFEALRAGATGYLLKRDILEMLYDAIVTLHSGGSPMSNTVARKVALAFRRFNENLSVLSKLTPREEAILRSVSYGSSNKELAEKFGVSVSTIETHLRNIYEKLQVNSRQEAAQMLRKS